MLKKYLFSDAEKASVEREIEIQQVRTAPCPVFTKSRVTATCGQSAAARAEGR